VVPAMFVLGAIFAGLWAVAIWLGLRYREAPWPLPAGQWPGV